jgi:hypothetical protein
VTAPATGSGILVLRSLLELGGQAEPMMRQTHIDFVLVPVAANPKQEPSPAYLVDRGDQLSPISHRSGRSYAETELYLGLVHRDDMAGNARGLGNICGRCKTAIPIIDKPLATHGRTLHWGQNVRGEFDRAY